MLDNWLDGGAPQPSAGDDLGDFTNVSGLSLEKRLELVRNSARSWGLEWIIIPNPSYGSWERAFSDPKDDPSVVLSKKCKALEAPGTWPSPATTR